MFWDADGALQSGVTMAGGQVHQRGVDGGGGGDDVDRIATETLENAQQVDAAEVDFFNTGQVDIQPRMLPHGADDAVFDFTRVAAGHWARKNDAVADVARVHFKFNQFVSSRYMVAANLHSVRWCFGSPCPLLSRPVGR